MASTRSYKHNFLVLTFSLGSRSAYRRTFKLFSMYVTDSPNGKVKSDSVLGGYMRDI